MGARKTPRPKGWFQYAGMGTRSPDHAKRHEGLWEHHDQTKPGIYPTFSPLGCSATKRDPNSLHPCSFLSCQLNSCLRIHLHISSSWCTAKVLELLRNSVLQQDRVFVALTSPVYFFSIHTTDGWAAHGPAKPQHRNSEAAPDPGRTMATPEANGNTSEQSSGWPQEFTRLQPESWATRSLDQTEGIMPKISRPKARL